jgi:hypothetical protein
MIITIYKEVSDAGLMATLQYSYNISKIGLKYQSINEA